MQTKLGNHISTQKGYAFKSSWYQTDGMPIVKVSDFTDDSIDISSLTCIPEEIAKEYTRYQLTAGDVVIQTVGSWPNNPQSVVGKALKTPSEANGALLNQNAVRLDPSEDLDKTFMFYLLRNSHFKDYIVGCAQGAASQASITLEAIRDYSFELPSPSTQRRIADILSAYDDLIENNTRRIRILEGMARAIYQEWFGNFGKDSQPADGWEKISYADLLESYSGGDWGEEQPDEKENCPAVIIRGTDFPEVRTGGLIKAPTRYISKTSLERRGLKVGDIIVENSVNASSRCVGTTLLVTKGVLKRIGEDSICASFCKNFRLKDPSLAPLVYLHMRFLHEENLMPFYQNVAANGIGNFQAERFVNSEYIFLPKDKARLKEILETFANLTAGTFSDQITNLRQTRDMLLPRLVSGEIEVTVHE